MKRKQALDFAGRVVAELYAEGYTSQIQPSTTTSSVYVALQNAPVDVRISDHGFKNLKGYNFIPRKQGGGKGDGGRFFFPMTDTGIAQFIEVVKEDYPLRTHSRKAAAGVLK